MTKYGASLKELFLTYAILNLYMKTLSCRDAGCDCNYIAKGETEEEVIRDAAQHGMTMMMSTEKLTLKCTVASDMPICLAISTNGIDESLLRASIILRLISSRRSSLLNFIHYLYLS